MQKSEFCQAFFGFLINFFGRFDNFQEVAKVSYIGATSDSNNFSYIASQFCHRWSELLVFVSHFLQYCT